MSGNMLLIDRVSMRAAPRTEARALLLPWTLQEMRESVSQRSTLRAPAAASSAVTGFTRT